MFQKIVNCHFNFEDNTFNQETNNPALNSNHFPILNLNTLSQNDYKIDDGELINDYYFLNNFISSYPQINFKSNDKKIKTNTNNEKTINDKLLSFSIIKRKSDNNSQNIDLLEIGKLKSNLFKKTKLGRKRKNDNTIGEHNKYSNDNLRRKCKTLVLNSALEFLNEKIRDLYKGNIGSGISKKELVPLNRIYKVDTSIEKYKKFVYKTLGEIFSGNISTRFKINLPEYNKILIKRLLNDKDENKRLYFQRLFNIKFLKCIETFSGSDNCKELKGFKTFNDIKNSLDYEYEPEYINRLEYYLKNFGEILINKNRKKVRPKKEQKGKEEVCKDKK